MYRDGPMIFEGFRSPWSRQSQPFLPAQTWTLPLQGLLHPLPMGLDSNIDCSSFVETSRGPWYFIHKDGAGKCLNKPSFGFLSSRSCILSPARHCGSVLELLTGSKNERRLLVHERRKKTVLDHPCIEDELTRILIVAACRKLAAEGLVSSPISP